MKIKNLLLALLALPLMMVACEPDTPVDEVKDPTVAVTAGTATENSISFTVTSTEADEVAYLVVEGTEAPTASEVLANGAKIEANKNVELTATELKAETDYTIVAAAKNAKAVVKATAAAKTLAAGETPAEPSLTLKSASEMSFAAEGGAGEIVYELKNAVADTELEAEANVAWISNVTVAEKITFAVAANDGEAREGKITATYGTLSFEVKVKQAAQSQTPGSDKVEFTATNINASYENVEGLHMYVFELGDKEWKSNGWGVDGGTYYSFAVIAGSKGNGVLPNGTYSLADTYSANTIASDYAYRYQMADGTMVNGFEMYKDANVTITNGKIEANIELDRDGSIHHVVFEGDLAVSDGGSQAPTEFEATHTADKWYWGGTSSYGNKYMVSGEGFSLDVHFPAANATETTLTAGEYTWTNTSWWGYNDFVEFTTRSFVSDGVSVAVDSGKAVVSNDGDEYHIEITLAGRDGFTYMIEYNGKLNDKGDVGGEGNTLVVNTLGEGTYNSSACFYTFKAAGENFSFDLLVNDYQAKNNQILAGSYTHAPGKSYAGNKNYFFVDSFKFDGVTYKASEASTMSVEGDGTNVVITINLTMQSGDQFTVTYNGVVGGSANEGGSTELTKLATPTVGAMVVGDAATISWNEIAGAKSYTVTLDGTKVNTVETAYITYQNLGWETTHTVEVVANPADATLNLASDAGTATFTTEANPNPGEGGDDQPSTGGQSYEGWQFSAALDRGTPKITVTDGSHTVEFTLNQVAGGTFYILDNGTLNITKVVVNGVETTDASGTVEMSSNNSYYVTLNATINGVKYTGTSSNSVV